MTTKPIRERLLAEMRQWQVIDCHEHLPEESERISNPVDALTLFSHYTHNDLINAGLSREDYDRTQDHSLPLAERWALVRPYWERVRFTGYSRPILLAVRRFYGCDDLNDDTYEAISERMQAANTPGLYHRVLREACNIRLCLTQIGRIPTADQELLVPLLPAHEFISARTPEAVAQQADEAGGRVASLDDYTDVVRQRLRRAKAQGVVGLKMAANPHTVPPQEEVSAAFGLMLQGREYDAGLLADGLLNELLELAADEELVVAVHCGLIWTNWQDFSQLHPRHMIPLLMAHRRTRFDLYHAGLPWMRETGAIGKSFPNVWLNLCWTHIMAPAMTVSALNEWLDMVPYTKILGFGGDYAKPVEKVYGHLQMALEGIATVLAGRVEDGWMTEDQALRVAHAWLWDNPVELYRLDV
ncbi:MAG: amidohydrolase family protein [Armatimonadetes bacterium]|nr:amidohydrolase family protein [Armatimonadota bacterium]